VSYDETMHDDTALYACADGYETLVGDGNRVCNDGQWSGEAPYCSPKSNTPFYLNILTNGLDLMYVHSLNCVLR